jgi:hypothetical protein
MANKAVTKSQSISHKGGSKGGVNYEPVDNGTRGIQWIDPTDRQLAKNASKTVSGGNKSNASRLNKGK